MIVLLGLTSAIVYGVSDFFGGLGSRRIAPLIPAVWGIASGERFSPLGYAALAGLAVAAVLLGVTREQQGGRVGVRAVLLAAASGVGFGGYNVIMEATPAESQFAPLLVDLVVGAALFGAVLGVLRLVRGDSWWGGAAAPAPEDRAAGLGFAVGAGLLMAVANALLVWGLRLGELAVMGVLASLYPLGTVLLAFTVLRERLVRERLVPAQVLGVVLALAASVALVLA